MRLLLFFTTFPVRTETFLQREVEALAEADREFELWSLWGGGDRFAQKPIRRTPLCSLWRLLYALPYWLCRSPRRFSSLLRTLGHLRWRNATNFGENLLGFGLGVAWARTLEREATGDTVLHAVWASLPATVALSVHRLTGLPFSFSGHAYDLFEDGGDALLEEKVAAAFALRTTTEAGARRFREAGASEAQLVVIRRGFSAMPAFSPSDGPHGTLRIAVVGRFVPKMGYRLLAEVFDHLAVQSFSFEAKIVGDGPERDAFAEGQSRSGWATNVELLGAVPFATVLETLRWADVLLFTGEVAESGDQAGFPNILGEAMAIGCPVVATPVGGVGEVIVDRKNGQLASHASEFHAALVRLTSAPKKVRDEVLEARKWVENEFDAHRNMAHFWEFLEKNTPGF